LAAKNEENLTKTVEELNSSSGGRVIGQAGDITKKEDISKLVEIIYQEVGRLDHLVISAGGPLNLLFEETSDQVWQMDSKLKKTNFEPSP